MTCKYYNIFHMPTISHPPTHLSTQAAGVALLHQFARDRFREENLAEQLIEDAEQELDAEIYEFFSSSDELQDDQNDELNTSVTELQHHGDEHEMSPNSLIGKNDSSTTTLIGTPKSINNSSIGPLNSTAKPHDFSTDEPTYHSMVSSNENDLSTGSATDSSKNNSIATITNVSEHPTQKYDTSSEVTHGDSIYHSINTSGPRRDGINIATTSSDRISGSIDHESPITTRINENNRHCTTRLKPNLDKHLDSTFNALGRKLREIADDFAESNERKKVREKANGVELQDLSKKNFFELLDGLFANKITSESIVVLFFFCVDVAVRAYSEAHHMVVELLRWSFSYIINTVCKKVEELGGWETVLFNKMPSILISCAAVLGIAALTTYMIKTLRELHGSSP